MDNAQAAAKAGAHGVLVVTPYYNKPPQEGLLRHFTAVADASELPVMVYDIPGRSGIAIHTETLLRLAEHPRIKAVKDAKGDLFAASQVMARSDLQYYSGDDVLNLAHLTQGAVGIASVVGHVAGPQYAEMVAAVAGGDLPRRHRAAPPAHPRGERRHEHHPGRDHGQGRTAGAGRHRLAPRSACRWSRPPPTRSRWYATVSDSQD